MKELARPSQLASSPGFPCAACCPSFPATGITAHPENGGTHSGYPLTPSQNAAPIVPILG